MKAADPVVIIDAAESRIRADHVARWVAGQLRTRGPGQAAAIEREAVAQVALAVADVGSLRPLSWWRAETALAVARRAARAAIARELRAALGRRAPRIEDGKRPAEGRNEFGGAAD